MQCALAAQTGVPDVDCPLAFPPRVRRSADVDCPVVNVDEAGDHAHTRNSSRLGCDLCVLDGHVRVDDGLQKMSACDHLIGRTGLLPRDKCLSEALSTLSPPFAITVVDTTKCIPLGFSSVCHFLAKFGDILLHLGKCVYIDAVFNAGLRHIRRGITRQRHWPGAY